jgi:hypothetical protein
MAQYYASEAMHDPCEIRVVDYVEDEGAQSKHEMQKLLIGMAERAAAAVGKPTHKSGLPNWGEKFNSSGNNGNKSESLNDLDLARLPALGTYLASKGFFPQEGSASSLQQVWFETLLTKEKSIVEISEVGFNCGTSAMSFLGARADINLVSFDIGLHPYVGYAKQYVDTVHRGRHTLILGDSTTTLPVFRNRHKYECDLCFVDGGHSLDVAAEDCQNAYALLRPGGFMVVDDCLPHQEWGVGPMQAFIQFTQQNSEQICGVEIHSDVGGVLQSGGPDETETATHAWGVFQKKRSWL